eukprot:TRINITY_DN12447_c0_g4_i1.p1 TRINITY_DN12447_c0_g4~~TRINITY_DN12447_c0_g4_i1.p1  ORF type:complete len:265 (+),score=75.62 TRINITY_DN12447_c0_g4_i1:31-825(+)
MDQSLRRPHQNAIYPVLNPRRAYKLFRLRPTGASSAEGHQLGGLELYGQLADEREETVEKAEEEKDLESFMQANEKIYKWQWVPTNRVLHPDPEKHVVKIAPQCNFASIVTRHPLGYRFYRRVVDDIPSKNHNKHKRHKKLKPFNEQPEGGPVLGSAAPPPAAAIPPAQPSPLYAIWQRSQLLLAPSSSYPSIPSHTFSAPSSSLPAPSYYSPSLHHHVPMDNSYTSMYGAPMEGDDEEEDEEEEEEEEDLSEMEQEGNQGYGY